MDALAALFGQASFDLEGQNAVEGFNVAGQSPGNPRGLQHRAGRKEPILLASSKLLTHGLSCSSADTHGLSNNYKTSNVEAA